MSNELPSENKDILTSYLLAEQPGLIHPPEDRVCRGVAGVNFFFLFLFFFFFYV